VSISANGWSAIPATLALDRLLALPLPLESTWPAATLFCAAGSLLQEVYRRLGFAGHFAQHIRHTRFRASHPAREEADGRVRMMEEEEKKKKKKKGTWTHAADGDEQEHMRGVLVSLDCSHAHALRELNASTRGRLVGHVPRLAEALAATGHRFLHTSSSSCQEDPRPTDGDASDLARCLPREEESASSPGAAGWLPSASPAPSVPSQAQLRTFVFDYVEEVAAVLTDGTEAMVEALLRAWARGLARLPVP
jgi:hypothetical protein